MWCGSQMQTHTHRHCGGELFFGLENDIFTHTQAHIHMTYVRMSVCKSHSFLSPFCTRGFHHLCDACKRPCRRCTRSHKFACLAGVHVIFFSFRVAGGSAWCPRELNGRVWVLYCVRDLVCVCASVCLNVQYLAKWDDEWYNRVFFVRVVIRNRQVIAGNCVPD